MAKMNKFLLVLRQYETDPQIIQYTKYMIKVFKPSHLFVMWMTSPYEYPKKIENNFPKLKKTVDLALREEKIKSAKKTFQSSDLKKMDFIFAEGNPYTIIPRKIRSLGIKLLIMERNYPGFGPTLLVEKIVRKSPCSTLVVSGKSESELKNILVPIDFTQNSAIAVKNALKFKLLPDFKKVICLHYYNVPFNLSRLGIGLGEFTKLMEDNSKISFETFLNDFEEENEYITPLLEPDLTLVESLKESIKSHHVDLILMSNRGQDSVPMVIGSLTELILKHTNIPIFILKNKIRKTSAIKKLIRRFRSR